MGTTEIEGVIRNHIPQNNCVLYKKRVEVVDGELLTIYECETHKRETCRCGIEFTYHGKIYEAIKNSHRAV